jgi:hypothetical protein
MTDVNHIVDAILDAMQQYTKEVEENIPQLVDNTAKEMVQEIKATAPKNTGEYAKGWTVRKLGDDTRSKEGYAKVVCNPKRYYLTHLLEYGHAKKGGGRTAGKPHIRPACDKLLSEMEGRIERMLKR